MYNNLFLRLIKKNHNNVVQITVRHLQEFRGIKGRTFGRPPGESWDIKELVRKLNYKDPKLYYKIDIGLPPPRAKRVDLYKKIKEFKSQRIETDLFQQENVSLEDIENEWLETEGPYHIKKIADHYGIYQDLFGDAYFYPFIRLQVAYKVKEEEYVPVYRGNIVKPKEAHSQPEVKFTGNPDKFYTIVLCTPDGHLTQEHSEYVHWMVGNIANCDVANGEVIKPFMQFFPVKGTGYLRYVYVLYEHDKPLDYSALKTNSEKINLTDRTFSTYDFYAARQDHLTPVGMVFHQSDWDWSVQDFFHKKLNIQEPIYEYDAPEATENRQVLFPHEKSFNTYMDRYRDPKQVAKELLLKKLKTHHPFKRPDPPLKYPAAHIEIEYPGYLPSWKEVEIKKERLGWGIINYHKDMMDPK